MRQRLRDQVRAFEHRVIEQAIAETGSERLAARCLSVELSQLKLKRKRGQAVIGRQTVQAPDEPLAWALRWNGDRVELGACWTRDELDLEVRSQATAALFIKQADARRVLREMNTTIAVQAAERSRQTAYGHHLQRVS